MISNFQAHLKIHFKDINNADKTNTENVIVVHMNNENELDDILREI